MMHIISHFNISEVERGLINDDIIELMKPDTFPLNLTVRPKGRQQDRDSKTD